ncbi:MAG: hydroxyacylglutathione hydrolase [Buchnera aphidicola (Meitanaphis microgallis)]
MRRTIIKCVPILHDNYVWIIINHNKSCIIIDPGCHITIIRIIEKLNIFPVAILVTHRHNDHVGGIKRLSETYPNLSIYGPKETKKFGTNRICTNNDEIHILNFKFKVLSTPGHTSGHISYYKKPHLFCGDTLFYGGCGKIENGMALKMYNSLKKIKCLPDNTLIYCSHEYTLNNLRFSSSVFPNNKKISKLYKEIQTIRQKNQCSLPSKLKIEKMINPFLNLDKIEVKKFTKIHKDLMFQLNILIQLRKIKEKNNWS